jgi:hypothetical protein
MERDDPSRRKSRIDIAEPILDTLRSDSDEPMFT